MNPRYRDLIKHSGIYGLGQMIARFASVMMLPVYTRYLTPADYGTIAILDLTVTVLVILVSTGVVAAVNRYHHDADSDEARDAIWWTGLTVAGIVAAAIAVPILLFVDELAGLLLGRGELSGGRYLSIQIAWLCIAVVNELCLLYFRVRKWSSLILRLSVGSLVLNALVNAYLLVVAGWGVTGVLTGNLIAITCLSTVQFAIVLRSCRRYRFDRVFAGHLYRFAGPVMVVLLLATGMHQADRYILRQLADLEAVGVYALAYQIGQAVNALVLVPFSTIWGVVLYEVAREPDAKAHFARIFKYFVYVVALFMLGVSLVVEPMLAVLAPAEWGRAATLVPVICLAFVFFSMSDHFQVPVLLAKRTVNLIQPNAVAVVLNILLNVLLVPVYGVAGAAWISVVTYMAYAGVLLARCRRIDHYDYPLGTVALVLAGMIGSVVAHRYLARLAPATVWVLGSAAAIWLVWAIALLLPAAVRYIPSLRRPDAGALTVE